MLTRLVFVLVSSCPNNIIKKRMHVAREMLGQFSRYRLQHWNAVPMPYEINSKTLIFIKFHNKNFKVVHLLPTLATGSA